MRRKPGRKPYPTPNCTDCGEVMTRRPTGNLVRFECFNPECGVIEVRIYNLKNRVVRVARKGL